MVELASGLPPLTSESRKQWQAGRLKDTSRDLVGQSGEEKQVQFCGE